jgi:hypothetical protein
MRKIALAAFALAAAGLFTPAWAQDMTTTEVSGGYNLLRFSDETLPAGWYVDVAGNVTDLVGVVGQVSGNYKSVDVFGVDVNTKVHTFMGGVRASRRATPRAAAFGQVLFGMARFDASSTLSGLLPFSIGGSTSDPALQVGGGVNLSGDQGVGFRVGADYMRIFAEGDGANVFRFSAGAVFPF